jgi:hypothetical protein
MKRIILAVLAATALGACTTAPAEPRLRGLEKYADDPRLGPEKRSICFASNIDGFSLNERETVVLQEGRDQYMVEVTAGCADLEIAETIAVDSHGGCLTPGDSIIVASTLGDSFGSNRCLIREIREWNPKAGKPAEAAEENPA